MFLCNLAKNAVKILRTGKGKPDLSSLLSADDVSQLAVERWMLPRSERRPEFRLWKRENIEALLRESPPELALRVRKMV